MRRLIVDIETDGLLEDATRVWCIGIYDPDRHVRALFHDDPEIQPRTGSIEDARRVLERTDRLFVMHNGACFDVPMLERLLGWDLSKIRLWDTLLVSERRASGSPGAPARTR